MIDFIFDIKVFVTFMEWQWFRNVCSSSVNVFSAVIEPNGWLGTTRLLMRDSSEHTRRKAFSDSWREIHKPRVACLSAGAGCDRSSVHVGLCSALPAHPGERQHRRNHSDGGRKRPCSRVHRCVSHCVFQQISKLPLVLKAVGTGTVTKLPQ